MNPNPLILRLGQIAREPLPPIQWLVEGIMGYGDKVIVAGDYGGLKTWLLFHLTLHLVLGKEWLDFPVPTERRVLYVDEETPEWEVRRRFKRIMAMEGVDPNDPRLDNLVIIPGMGFTTSTNGLAALNAIMARERFVPEVIVLETLARIQEGDENSVGAIAQLWRNVRQYLQERRTTVIISHHMNKPGIEDTRELRHRIRGSTDIPAGGDTIIGLKSLSGPLQNQSRVESVKPRFSRPFEPFRVMLVEQDPRDRDNTPLTIKRMDRRPGAPAPSEPPDASLFQSPSSVLQCGE